MSGTPIVELDDEQTQSMIDQHIWTLLNLVKAAVPGMAERGWDESSPPRPPPP